MVRPNSPMTLHEEMKREKRRHKGEWGPQSRQPPRGCDGNLMILLPLHKLKGPFMGLVFSLILPLPKNQKKLKFPLASKSQNYSP